MGKEKLNYNRNTATLFVGVGGIGSDIVTKVANLCHERELENLRFVAMDTDANWLKGVRNSKVKVEAVQTSSTQSVLDYLKNDDDARKHWFPNNTTLYPKTVSEGAGQVRAISRLALNATIKTGNISHLYQAIDQLFLKDGEESKQALRVVVVSSAAGGTGSGISMIVGMLIRDYLHKHYRERAAIVRGYLLLPGVMDTVIRTETERESLRRNGYATIKEINAFMIKASGFCGVRKDLERYKDLHVDVPTTTNGVERLENLPFDFCFLLDRMDQSQVSMTTLDQYKDFAARSLYEQNIGPMQGRAFSMEDNIIKEFANGDNLGRNRFGGIGASVLRYPYEEVVEYIAYGRAMDRIGADSVDSWLKYDKKFKEEMAEFKKKRALVSGDAPKIADVYVAALTDDEQRFGMDVKSYLVHGNQDVVTAVDDRIDNFISALEDEIRDTFVTLPDVQTYDTQVNALRKKINYEEDERTRGNASDNLEALRTYESLIKSRGVSVATSRAKAIFLTAPIVTTTVQDYHLESLVRTTDGAMHPNAMRYMLYSTQKKLEEKKEEYDSKLLENKTLLQNYSTTADKPNMFDIDGRGEFDGEEKNIDDVVSLEKQDVSILEKRGMQKLWDALNKHFPGYSNALMEYRDALLFSRAVTIALEHISRLNKELELFYGSFPTKVVELGKKKDDIVEQLRFKKGNSIRYVCGEKDYLDSIAASCPEGSEGLLLPDALNAKIFEAIKANAESARMAEYDPYGNNPKQDVFDTVLIGYFRDSIRLDCDDVVNMNIIKAIYTEYQLHEMCEANKLTEEGQEPVIPQLTEMGRQEYLRKIVNYGSMLASAGIGFSSFNEPRDIAVCAFNENLVKLREMDIKVKIESMSLSPVPSDTVSKYDLRFYKALYNITPDQLARFKAPEMISNGDGSYSESAGIYYQAYHKYIRNIGPDSTKSSTISLHIDKRWDSLSEMEEISMDANYKEMIKIHSALIYGVVYGMIKTHPSSRRDAQKRIFALEDNEGDLTNLIVSNETECDEFYEVLDALYRDRASVSKIFDMAAERHKFDVEYNRRYEETTFFKEASSFHIGDGHRGKTSLFEIPLMYYNSLPRAKLDDNELAIMIDSVIGVMEQEVNRYEQSADQRPLLSDRLEDQFRLLVDNFNNDEYNENEAMRKNSSMEDNRVMNMTMRKVCNKIKELDTFNFDDKIDALRALVRG